uniref:Uncharacterized protein n=1 Tax=Rhizophora mucronata TaxID=61149 RepID=A0A2P2PRE3_RHIMU
MIFKFLVLSSLMNISSTSQILLITSFS